MPLMPHQANLAEALSEAIVVDAVDGVEDSLAARMVRVEPDQSGLDYLRGVRGTQI